MTFDSGFSLAVDGTLFFGPDIKRNAQVGVVGADFVQRHARANPSTSQTLVVFEDFLDVPRFQETLCPFTGDLVDRIDE